MSTATSPFFPERLLAQRPRFAALRAQFGQRDFYSRAEPTWELRDALRDVVPAWQQQHQIPAELLASEPPHRGGAGVDFDSPEGRAWFDWYHQIKAYRLHYPRLEEELHATKALLAFHRAGRNIFSLAPGLLEMLRNTAVDTVRAEDIPLPYPAIYLHFGPASQCQLPMYWYEYKYSEQDSENIMGIEYWLDGAFVERNGRILDVTLTFRSEEDDFTRRVPQERDFRFPVVSFSIDFNAGNPASPAGNCAEAAVSFSSLGDEKGEALEIRYGRMRELLLAGEFEYESERADYQLFERSMMLIVNSLCYLNLPECTMRREASKPEAEALLVQLRQAKNKQRRQPIQQKLERLSYSTIRFFGEEFNALVAEGRGGAGEVAPHWRRGHWRRQPIGAGRSDIRLMWIKPVIVRSDKGSPEQGHVYEVTD